ncbi:hypothetical protein [Halorarum halobium]|nr:hypothetical protein [Halobaculum sp. XH14]
MHDALQSTAILPGRPPAEPAAVAPWLARLVVPMNWSVEPDRT